MISTEVNLVLVLEFFYADDLVIIAESLEALILKLLAWKDKMENKCLMSLSELGEDKDPFFSSFSLA